MASTRASRTTGVRSRRAPVRAGSGAGSGERGGARGGERAVPVSTAGPERQGGARAGSEAWPVTVAGQAGRDPCGHPRPTSRHRIPAAPSKPRTLDGPQGSGNKSSGARGLKGSRGALRSSFVGLSRGSPSHTPVAGP